MNEEEKYKKSKFGKIDRANNKGQSNDAKVLSGERLSQNKEIDSIRISKNNLKKLKKKFSSKKRKKANENFIQSNLNLLIDKFNSSPINNKI